MILSTQTAQQKRDAYADFLRRMVEQGVQGLQDDIHNYMLITQYIEQMGLPVAHDSLVKAVNANSQLLHWLPSQAEQQRQQQAAETAKAHDAEVNRCIEDFCSRHQEFVKCDENLNLIVKFIQQEHKSVLGPVQLEHFWRVYQDSADLVRRASNTPALSSGLLKPRDDWGERQAEKSRQREQQAAAVKTRAEFDLAIQKIAKIVIDGSRGVSWGKTSEARINALEAASRQYPQFSNEVDRLIQKEKSRFRF